MTSLHNLTNALVTNRSNPLSQTPKSSEKLSENSEECSNTKEGTNSVLMPMVLDWADMGVIVRHLHAIDHIV